MMEKRRSAEKRHNQNLITSFITCFNNHESNGVYHQPDSKTDSREKERSTVDLSHVWMEQRNLQPMISPPLVAPMPTRPPVSGGYGRLDSPWRVRSHLKTLGQPKAGTVTITQPQSLTKHAAKNSQRRDLTGEVVGLRWRGIWVIIRDEQKHKSTLFHSGGPLWPRTGIWSSVNCVESSTKTLNLHLMRICLQLVEIQFCTKWVKRQVKNVLLHISDGCGQKKGTLYREAEITNSTKGFSTSL